MGNKNIKGGVRRHGCLVGDKVTVMVGVRALVAAAAAAAVNPPPLPLSGERARGETQMVQRRNSSRCPKQFTLLLAFMPLTPELWRLCAYYRFYTGVVVFRMGVVWKHHTKRLSLAEKRGCHDLYTRPQSSEKRSIIPPRENGG